MTFESLGLISPLLKSVKKQGYNSPSPIQLKTIPIIIEGHDILASAQTGTGKTAAFTLPMLQKLNQISNKRHRSIRALVLTPTRELADQVYSNIKEYSEFLDFKTTVIYGGVNQKPQVKKLRSGIDILVSTPGRLIDLEGQRHLSLSKVEIFVLDEADRMLDMGFKRDIDKIISLIPSKRQNLMFSATFSKDIKKLAHTILKYPKLINASPENSMVEAIKQKVFRVSKEKKTKLLIKLISDGNWKQVLIFTRTKHGANKLCEKLVNAEISSLAIHGNKSQSARKKALFSFKKNEIRVLVATDIAARGLDIPLLPNVVNFELPNVPQDYIHRIGRTGRAGANGVAISLVCAEETSYLLSIEQLINKKFKKEIINGFEPDLNASTEPPKIGGNRQNRRSRSKKTKAFSKKKSRKPFKKKFRF
tara:strand:+ start:7890 stop:9149 length:1260 start_codon:yes stop_codon:yes gene_type:complete